MIKFKKALKVYFYCLKKSKKDISNYVFGLKCLSLFLCTIFAYGQTNTKSGNIRSCSVWNNATVLQDARIIDGTAITSNPTSTSVNSITFLNTGALDLNLGESVAFGASSVMPCGTTEIPVDNPYTGAGYVMNGGWQCGGYTNQLNNLPAGTKLTVTVYYTTTRTTGTGDQRVCGGLMSSGCASKAYRLSVFIQDNAGRVYPTQTIDNVCTGSIFTFNNIDFVSQSTSRFQVCHMITVDCSSTGFVGPTITSQDHSFRVNVTTNDIF